MIELRISASIIQFEREQMSEYSRAQRFRAEGYGSYI